MISCSLFYSPPKGGFRVWARVRVRVSNRVWGRVRVKLRVEAKGEHFLMSESKSRFRVCVVAF